MTADIPNQSLPGPLEPPPPMTTGQPSASIQWKSNGRLQALDARESDRMTGLFLHLSPLLFIPMGPLFVLVPVIIWLALRNRSGFVNDHGREQLNFMISFLLLHLLLTITIVGIMLIPVYWVVCILGVIRGAIAAANGEYFRYPATIRILG